MKTYHAHSTDGVIYHSGNSESLREFLEDRFEGIYNFRPLLQASEDEGYLEIYLHTDSFEILNDEEICSLERLGITENDSLNNLLILLNIRIGEWSMDEIASCTLCNRTYHEDHVNIVDFEEDVCDNCFPKVKSDK